MKNSKLSLQEVWRLGCNDETLEPDDQKRFASMARSRFHTFQMGMSHAQEQSDDQKLQSLVAGLAIELNENPGLKKGLAAYGSQGIRGRGAGQQSPGTPRTDDHPLSRFAHQIGSVIVRLIGSMLPVRSTIADLAS